MEFHFGTAFLPFRPCVVKALLMEKELIYAHILCAENLYLYLLQEQNGFVLLRRISFQKPKGKLITQENVEGIYSGMDQNMKKAFLEASVIDVLLTTQKDVKEQGLIHNLILNRYSKDLIRAKGFYEQLNEKRA